jgi:hypothetical protein
MLGHIDEPQQQHKLQLMKVLSKHLPKIAVEYCSELIMYYKLHLHIEVERKDRLGDYSPHLGKGNRISINHNLSPYDFLITFIHELAHHTAYKKYGSKHSPHGPEWKNEFKQHMRPIVMAGFFPPDIAASLIAHMKKPAYTHSGDVNLTRALLKYDKRNVAILLDLKKGDHFKIGRTSRIILKKGEAIKNKFHCVDVKTDRQYLVHEGAVVIPVTASK